MDELLGGNLAGGTEGGGMGNGSPAVTEGIEGGMDEVHGCGVFCLMSVCKSKL